MISEQNDALVITVSATENSKGLYISSQDNKGFWVAENDNGNHNTTFSWIALATRKGYENISHAPELLKTDFDKKMNGVMFNDNNTIDQPQSLWWDGNGIRFDTPPAKKVDPQFNPSQRINTQQ